MTTITITGDIPAYLNPIFEGPGSNPSIRFEVADDGFRRDGRSFNTVDADRLACGLGITNYFFTTQLG